MAPERITSTDAGRAGGSLRARRHLLRDAHRAAPLRRAGRRDVLRAAPQGSAAARSASSSPSIARGARRAHRGPAREGSEEPPRRRAQGDGRSDRRRAQIGAPIPPEPQTDPESVRSNAIPHARRAARKRWSAAPTSSARCSSRVRPEHRPAQLASLLRSVERARQARRRFDERSVTEQNKLEEIAKRGRDGRRASVTPSTALGADTSTRPRRAARRGGEVLATSKKHRDREQALRRGRTRRSPYWEGRSGFAEPYEDLMNAYRDAAEVDGGWIDRARDERDAERHRRDPSAGRARSRVPAHEAARVARRCTSSTSRPNARPCERLVLQMTQEIDAAEEELVSLATALVRAAAKTARARPPLPASRSGMTHASSFTITVNGALYEVSDEPAHRSLLDVAP